jgi:LytS/YehU family sensor histidine kinase
MDIRRKEKKAKSKVEKKEQRWKAAVVTLSDKGYAGEREDKSGSGVGLEQVSRRLEILYPGAYTWLKGVSKDEKVYESRLSIKIRE